MAFVKEREELPSPSNADTKFPAKENSPENKNTAAKVRVKKSNKATDNLIIFIKLSQKKGLKDYRLKGVLNLRGFPHFSRRIFFQKSLICDNLSFR